MRAQLHQELAIGFGPRRAQLRLALAIGFGSMRAQCCEIGDPGYPQACYNKKNKEPKMVVHYKK